MFFYLVRARVSKNEIEKIILILFCAFPIFVLFTQNLKRFEKLQVISSSRKLTAPFVSWKEIEVKDETKFGSEIFSGLAFSPAQRCKVVFPCSNTTKHTIELCGTASVRGLLLVKYVKGKFYVGREDNKFLKKCVLGKEEAKRTESNKWSTEILDPINRGKRLLFFLLTILRELLDESGSTMDRNLSESLILIDSYDIPQFNFLPKNSVAFSTVPFYNNTLSATIPVTKLEYNITSKGKVIGIRDSLYDQLKGFQGKEFVEREDRLIFSGRIKSTRTGFQYGRKRFDTLARKDKSRSFRVFKSPAISFVEQAEYRYIISLSGAGAWTFFRVYTFMLGSVVFCQESSQKLWYDEYFHPMVHYIPVQEDLLDLKEKLRWARNNLETAANIARAARTLAIEVFSPRKIMNEYKERIANHILQKEKYFADNYKFNDLEVCNNKTVYLCEGPKVCKSCIPQ